MSKNHVYSPIIHEIALFQTLKKKLCSERSRNVLHVRILLIVRYSQWTRTVTELPIVKGVMTKCNGVYIIILLYII